MNSFQLSSIINAVANCIAKDLSNDELALISAIFVQLGDTLVTIAAQKALCSEKNPSVNQE